jgi:hypothetical protein
MTTKKTETKAVAVSQDELTSRALAMKENASQMAVAMADLGVEASDLQIPLLHLIQPTSPQVADGKAKLGDIFDTLNEGVMGGIGKGVEIIPLRLFKTLRIYDTTVTPRKFMREEVLSPANDKLPFEGNENGVAISRYVNLNFYVLLKSHVTDSEAFPYVIRFKSSSLYAGKQLATQLFKMVALRKLPYSQTVIVGARKEQKEKNTFAVFEIQKGNPATETEKKEAEHWLAILASVTTRIVEADEESEEAAQSSAPRAPTVVESESVAVNY